MPMDGLRFSNNSSLKDGLLSLCFRLFFDLLLCLFFVVVICSVLFVCFSISGGFFVPNENLKKVSNTGKSDLQIRGRHRRKPLVHML